MTMHQDLEKVASVSNLLTLKEQALCEQIGSGEAPHNKRALALLALNEGITQARAAEQAGLTIGQVKYWLAKFRKQRLGIFPDILMDELNVVAEGTELEPVTEIEGATEPEMEERGSPADKAKVKKGRKGKKVKKTKKKTGKTKKDKKKKKTKKTKKKTGKGKKKSEIRKGKKDGKGKKDKKGKKAKKSKK